MAPSPFQWDDLRIAQAVAETGSLSAAARSLGLSHSTVLRRLSAFEEYSQTCGAENWKQAAVHACVYSYANQARYLIEKALRTVLDE